jgi:hypothetical protein
MRQVCDKVQVVRKLDQDGRLARGGGGGGGEEEEEEVLLTAYSSSGAQVRPGRTLKERERESERVVMAFMTSQSEVSGGHMGGIGCPR